MKRFLLAWPVCLILLMPVCVQADLIPTRVLVHVAHPCWNAIQSEDSMHDQNLLGFRGEKRDAQTACEQKILDCRLQKNAQPCINEATAEERRRVTDINKRELAENNRHLKRLDEIMTTCRNPARP
jgi:hypothetical protein